MKNRRKEKRFVILRKFLLLFLCVSGLLCFVLQWSKQVKKERDETVQKTETVYEQGDCLKEAELLSEENQESISEIVPKKAEITSHDEEPKKGIQQMLYEKEAGTVLTDEELQGSSYEDLFVISDISNSLFEKMNGNSFHENEVIGREELRLVKVLYVDFGGNTCVGELVVNQKIAEPVREIMLALYEHRYPIDKMVLIDEYGGNDDLSMEDDNSSAFNYRTIAGTDRLSNHALGMAIDINPKYNPYVYQRKGEWICEPENGKEYQDRSKVFPYKIEEGDFCLQMFREKGFSWGGDWKNSKDYQHFEFVEK